MLSYALYSMSMHAFHIPLAALVGMRLSKLEGGVSSDGGRAIMIVTLLLCGVAHSALSGCLNTKNCMLYLMVMLL